ncbi:MAG: hypothetical protein JJ979_03285 [Roseibium sp.]|nr:hypothetical protein [Roseibium sp.]
MNYLKITAKGFAKYSGFLGPVEFKDGVSVEPVPALIATRIGGTMQVAEVDENGKEITQAGPAAAIVGGATIQAEVRKPLERVSEEEIEKERKAAAKKAEEAERLKQVVKFYSEEELAVVADKEGLKGLRAIAEPYGVRGRAINELIEEILEAQAKHQTAQTGERLVQGAEEVVTEPEVEEIAEEAATEQESTEETPADQEAAEEASTDETSADNAEGSTEEEASEDAPADPEEAPADETSEEAAE